MGWWEGHNNIFALMFACFFSSCFVCGVADLNFSCMSLLWDVGGCFLCILYTTLIIVLEVCPTFFQHNQENVWPNVILFVQKTVENHFQFCLIGHSTEASYLVLLCWSWCYFVPLQAKSCNWLRKCFRLYGNRFIFAIHF